MVFDLLTLAAIPTVVGASEAVNQQRLLDEEAESEERQAPFYLDVFCDAKSSKRDEVHDAIVVLKDGKVRHVSNKIYEPLLTKTVSYDYGPKTPTQVCQRKDQKANQHRIRSLVSTSLSQPKTYPIALCLRRLSSAL